MMNRAIQFGNSIVGHGWDSAMLMSEKNSIESDQSTDKCKPKHTQNKIPPPKDVASDLCYPENAAGPDPTEEEQRDRDDKEQINTEEDRHKENPDHSEENIYDADSDKDADLDKKEKDKKNSLS